METSRVPQKGQRLSFLGTSVWTLESVDSLILPNERRKYEQHFHQLDADRDGFVQGKPPATKFHFKLLGNLVLVQISLSWRSRRTVCQPDEKLPIFSLEWRFPSAKPQLDGSASIQPYPSRFLLFKSLTCYCVT